MSKRYYVVRFLGANTRVYHTHEDCCRLDRLPLREITNIKGLRHCKFCAERDRRGEGAA
jgi:hypothetical protein